MAISARGETVAFTAPIGLEYGNLDGNSQIFGGELHGTWTFTKPKQDVSEGAGSFTVKVQRAGDITRSGQVEYLLVSGTATVGIDVPARGGTLVFGG